MIFENVPKVIGVELYDEAAQLYAKKVGKRAVAVYQVGTVHFPGLSDLDLLVVAPDSRRDNNQFFSVFDRLPPRYHTLFLHQPFVLPETTLEVIQHTNHTQPLLLAGTHVFGDRRPLATREERWCRILEAFCNLDVYLSHCLEQNRTAARLAVAVANSMRYPLRDLDEIFSTNHAAPYAQEIDAGRAALLANPSKSLAIVAEIWNALYAKMGWLRTYLSDFLPLEQNESVRRFATRFLQGHLPLDSLDASTVFERRQKVDFYHDELRRLRFSYGHLFFFAAYDTASQRYDQRQFERRFYSLYYRVRKHLAL